MHGHGKNGIVELIFSDMITVADTDHLPLPLKATMSDLLTFTCRRREQTLLTNKRAFYCVFAAPGPVALLPIVAAIAMRPHKMTQPGRRSEVLKESARGLGCQNGI